MGVQERLTLEAVAESTLLAAEHVHRYEFAAELCTGLRVLDLCCGSGYGSEILAAGARSVHGVDYDAATIATATATVGLAATITFELADATAFLRQDLADRFDTIVCFEGLEHLAELELTMLELRRHAAAGVAVIASVPNSRGMGEDNEFHVSSFGYIEASEAFGGFPGGRIVHQYLAEGSLIVLETAGGADVRLHGLERAEPPYANHYLLVTGSGLCGLGGVHHARLQVNPGAAYNRYMRSLDRANRELRRQNAKCTRWFLGRQPTAPLCIARTEARLAELVDRQADIVEMQAELDWQQRRIERLDKQLEQARAETARAAPPSPRTRLATRLARRLGG